MNCPKCGTVLEEDARFCVSCGAPLEKRKEISSYATEAQNVVSGAPKKENRKESKSNKVGLVAGTLLIIIGLLRVMNAGTSISEMSFGGDFYTYTYQGIVAVSEMLAVIEQSLGWLIAAVGVLIDIVSAKH